MIDDASSKRIAAVSGAAFVAAERPAESVAAPRASSPRRGDAREQLTDVRPLGDDSGPSAAPLQVEYFVRPLTDRERVALRRVALPTLLAALTWAEIARAAGVDVVERETDLAEAAAWLAERHGRRGRPRALRIYRTRAVRALEAAQVLDDAIERAARWAVRFAREMTAVRDAERLYERFRCEADIEW